MKKMLMLGISALVFAGCSNSFDLGDTPAPQADTTVEDYEAAFVSTFGTPAADQTWGFGTSTSSQTRSRRAITVNGDVYDAFPFPSSAEITAAFPTAVPDDADEVADLETLYKGTTIPTQWGTTTLWDLYAIYVNKITEGYNLKITQAGEFSLGGTYQNAGWDSEKGINTIFPYNVYVNVDGDVTIKRNGATHFNLYVLKGNVTLLSDYGEQGGIISVASGATLTDNRTSIASNYYIKVYNRGTINAANSAGYDIGNNCTVYNEGAFNVTGPMSYSPGAGNTSYFVNCSDDSELTAPSMTLNSTCNFFNDGKTTISGVTNVTQSDIFWVNNGFYRTGTLIFSAKNSTFYNYCQLIVEDNAHMYDGAFNLMADSYTEAGTAEMDNFQVNMYGESGMYIKGNVDIAAQGDGTFQGFHNANGSGSYVLIDGMVTVASHYHTLSIESGITYSINDIQIVKGGSIVTEEYLQSIGDGDYPVLVLEGTECPFGELTVIPNTNSCGATWTASSGGGGGGGGEIVVSTLPSLHVMAEDLSATDASDFDFNDCVFDVYYVDANTVKIKVLAAGGTLPLRICEKDGWEMHNIFDVDTQCMVNTGNKYHKASAPYSQEEGYDAVELTYTDKTWSSDQGTFAGQVRDQIKVEVYKDGAWHELKADQGKAAGKIATPVNIYMESAGWYPNEYRWPYEKQYIGNSFNQYVSDPSVVWYNTK